MTSFSCKVCGTAFEVPQTALDKYPGWEPKYCREHSPKKSAAASKKSGGGRGGGGGARRTRVKKMDEGPRLTTSEVLAQYADPGQDGVFTDGSCTPNPGPGGWGAVWVEGGEVRAELCGHEPDTTNNRMELKALVEAYRMLPDDVDVTVHSDSNLCVQTVNQWAPGWAARGWKRKSGPIANLDLVQELWALVQERPRIRLQWIEAHTGHRWNEYADALAASWMRD